MTCDLSFLPFENQGDLRTERTRAATAVEDGGDLARNAARRAAQFPAVFAEGVESLLGILARVRDYFVLPLHSLAGGLLLGDPWLSGEKDKPDHQQRDHSRDDKVLRVHGGFSGVLASAKAGYAPRNRTGVADRPASSRAQRPRSSGKHPPPGRRSSRA